MPYYLGPRDAIRLIPDPNIEAGASPDEAFYVSQRTLSGASVVDRVGTMRQTWEMAFDYLSPEDASYFEACRAGEVGTPLYFLDALRPNRMHRQAATGGSALQSSSGFTTSLGFLTFASGIATPSNIFTVGALNWSGLAAGATITVPRRIPVLTTGETIRLSVWVYGPAVNVQLGLTQYTAAGVPSSSLGLSTGLSPSIWSRIDRVLTTTVGTTSVVPYIVFPANALLASAQIRITGWQCVLNTVPAGTWYPGGGAAEVVLPESKASNPFGDYTNVSLMIREA